MIFKLTYLTQQVLLQVRVDLGSIAMKVGWVLWHINPCSVVYRNTYTTINIQIFASYNQTMNFNERMNTLYKNITHFILERVDVGCVWEMRTDCYIDPAVLISHLGWVAQPWVTEGPKPSVCRWLSIQYLVSNQLKPSVPWLYCLMPTCFHCSSAYLLRCISWLMAWSRVNT